MVKHGKILPKIFLRKAVFPLVGYLLNNGLSYQKVRLWTALLRNTDL
jgi:hypothetical protein